MLSLLSKKSKSFRTTYFTSKTGTLVRFSKTYYSDSIGKDDTQNKVDYEELVEKKLKDTFDKRMKNNAYPLFADFDTYKKWMPVRLIKNDFRQLYKLPHYTNENDLDFLVKQLEEPPKSRREVKYFAAPGKSGKTCAILPAFLRSAEKDDGFTHYIYLAFNNNDTRNFIVEPLILILITLK